MKDFIKICRMNQPTLKTWLGKELKKYYKGIVIGDGFIYTRGSKILITAHMDTVHKEQCKKIIIEKIDGINGKQNILSSPVGIGGDDRCGIWMIMKLLKETKFRPTILFCEDEEIGGVGSNKFVKTNYIDELKEKKYFIELDRANGNDAVYYDCGNEEFMDYIEETIGYKEAYGSFSDIGHLSPATDVASVNLSCGYYKAHTTNEYVIFEEMRNTLEKVKVLLADEENCKAYDYQEYTGFFQNQLRDYYNYSYFGNKYDYSKGGWYDDEDDWTAWYINYLNIDGKEDFIIVDGYTEAEAVGNFLMEFDNLTYGHILEIKREA